MNTFQKAFTLIELLVVIAIIGILATLIMTNVQGVRERSRDLKRKANLSSLQNSLRLYYNDAKEFPSSNTSSQIIGCGTTASPTVCAWGSAFSKNSTSYMSRLPLDPSSTTTSPIAYQYQRSATNSDQYLIVAKLENLSDADITTSQANCAALYASFSGTKDTTKDYVVCAE